MGMFRVMSWLDVCVLSGMALSIYDILTHSSNDLRRLLCHNQCR